VITRVLSIIHPLCVVQSSEPGAARLHAQIRCLQVPNTPQLVILRDHEQAFRKKQPCPTPKSAKTPG
jgi:hypothetical protein